VDYRITNEIGSSRTDEVVHHLSRPRLWVPESDYPDFAKWVERAHGQIKAGGKRAMVALDRGNIVGLVLYQRHQEVADTLEVKNISVHPEFGGRYLASVLLRNVEVEGSREFRARHVVVDAKARNTAIRFFLLRHRYLVQDSLDLYGLGAGRDLVFKKTVTHE
jgi:ribosomal protein S18 acetylase RimI-like enzyme